MTFGAKTRIIKKAVSEPKFKILKKTQKNLKKGLTNANECDIIIIVA